MGAGPGGLAAALVLKRAGLEIAVLEAGDEPGGRARTLKEGEWRAEWGPHTFDANGPGLARLVDLLGLGQELVAPRTAARRYIWRGGRLHPLPSSPLSFLFSPLLTLAGRLRLLAEPFRFRGGYEGESVADFFARRLGPEAARVLAGSFVSGVWAGDPASLEMSTSFPRLAGWEHSHGSILRGAIGTRGGMKRSWRSLRGGLGSLADAAARDLGGCLHCATPADTIRRQADTFVVASGDRSWETRSLVLAVPPPVASALLRTVDPDISRSLSSIPMAPLSLVHLGGIGPAPAPEGFGALVPRGEGVRTLGLLFPGQLFDDRTPTGGWLLSAFVGGCLDPDAVNLSDAQLSALAQADAERMLRCRLNPAFLSVMRHPSGIPQFTEGHGGRINDIRETLKHCKGLHLVGNYLDGVSLDAAVQSGLDAAEVVVRRTATSTEVC